MGDFSDTLINGIADSLTGGVASGISGLLSTGINAISQNKQFQRTKKLMALEDKYQRNLAADEMSIKRRSLENAGYSTADPQGTGVTIPSTNASGGSVPLPSPDYNSVASGISALQQARFTASQTKLNEIEAQYRAQLLQKEIDKYNIDIKTAQEMLLPRLDEIYAHIDQMVSGQKLNIDQAKQVRQNTENLKAALDGIRLDNQFKEQVNPKLVDKTQAELDNLLKEGRIKEAEAKLADLGILASADMFTNFASVALTDKTGEITQKLVNTAKEVFKSAPAAAQEILDAAIDSAVENASTIGSRVVKGVKKAVKAPIEFGKGLYKEIFGD